MVIEKIPGENGRDYNRRLFIAQYKRSTGRYCMCISPVRISGDGLQQHHAMQKMYPLRKYYP